MLVTKECECCLHYERCEDAGICIHFTPLTEEYSDFEMDNIIESQRGEFYSEWFRYIEEDMD